MRRYKGRKNADKALSKFYPCMFLEKGAKILKMELCPKVIMTITIISIY